MTNNGPNCETPGLTVIMRDYSIPRRGQKTAIIRLEHPLTKDDIEQIRKWLELMENTLTDDNGFKENG